MTQARTQPREWEKATLDHAHSFGGNEKSDYSSKRKLSHVTSFHFLSRRFLWVPPQHEPIYELLERFFLSFLFIRQ